MQRLGAKVRPLACFAFFAFTVSAQTGAESPRRRAFRCAGEMPPGSVPTHLQISRRLIFGRYQQSRTRDRGNCTRSSSALSTTTARAARSGGAIGRAVRALHAQRPGPSEDLACLYFFFFPRLFQLKSKALFKKALETRTAKRRPSAMPIRNRRPNCRIP